MNRLFVLFLAFIPFVLSLKVHISTGILEGRVINATYSPFGNQSAWAFMGVPYARPPIGELRFRRAEAPAKWDGVLKAHEYKPACMSNPERTYKTKEGGAVSEDCLYLNVFTNDYCVQRGNCSVMIVVHGGGFLFESASAFDPQILINNFVGQDRNIVVVSVNYRLGVFGFGQLGGEGETKFVDKNLGLFDLLDSVKWTRREIGAFGGSKHRITIAGHSAGGCLITLLTLSPLSRGLLHQQIIMSGPLPGLSKSGNSKATRATAIRLGCLSPKMQYAEHLDESATRSAYQCLRGVSGAELLAAQLYVIANTTFVFNEPMVDGQMIVDYPDYTLKSKNNPKINTMIGTLTAELRDSMYCQDEEGNAIPERVRQLCSYLGYQMTFQDPSRFVESCVENYSKKNNSQFLTDDLEFYWGAHRIASSHVSPQTLVYLYSYSYTGAGNAFNKYLPTVPSPMHSEDLIYVFGTHRNIMQPKDYVIERIYSGLFANYVNFGDPSPSAHQKWAAFSDAGLEYFHVDFDADFRMPGTTNGYYETVKGFWSQHPNRRIERFAPPIDMIWTSSLVEPIVSHIEQVSADRDKSLEIMEETYRQFENYMAQFEPNWRDGEYLENGAMDWNLLLLIFSGLVLIIIICFIITRYLNRRRSGYQLLE